MLRGCNNFKNVYISQFWLGVGGGNHIYINFSQVQIILHYTRVCQKNNGTSFLLGRFPYNILFIPFLNLSWHMPPPNLLLLASIPAAIVGVYLKEGWAGNIHNSLKIKLSQHLPLLSLASNYNLPHYRTLPCLTTN